MRAWLAVIAGCGYHGGSFADEAVPFRGEQVALGCLDLAVGRGSDPQATGPVITYAFGNRCRDEVDVDLASIRAVAHDGGVRAPLVGFDPRREIRALPIPPLAVGHEAIEYRGTTIVLGSACDTQCPVGRDARVCVDVGAVERSAPPTERWVCP